MCLSNLQRETFCRTIDFKIFYKNKKPVGYTTWGFLNKKAEKKLINDDKYFMTMTLYKDGFETPTSETIQQLLETSITPSEEAE